MARELNSGLDKRALILFLLNIQFRISGHQLKWPLDDIYYLTPISIYLRISLTSEGNTKALPVFTSQALKPNSFIKYI